MRARLRLLGGLAIVLTIGVLAPALVRAATVEQLVDLATRSPHNMQCAESEGNVVVCSGGTDTASWYARIKPATGPEDSLQTYAQEFGRTQLLGTQSREWMATMHQTACGAPTKVAAFVNQVGDLTQAGQTVG